MADLLFGRCKFHDAQRNNAGDLFASFPSFSLCKRSAFSVGATVKLSHSVANRMSAAHTSSIFLTCPMHLQATTSRQAVDKTASAVHGCKSLQVVQAPQTWERTLDWSSQVETPKQCREARCAGFTFGNGLPQYEAAIATS